MKNIKKNLVFAIHNHQPFGNFDHVIDTSFRRCYRPLIDTLEKCYFVKTALHISGPLLLWMENNYPEHIEIIKKLYKRGQLEFLGGSYTEAILPMLKKEERVEQINRYKDLINRVLGENIVLKGFWVTERVWMPELVSDLSDSGYEYVFLDHTHIIKAGNFQEDCIYNMEYHGNSIKILPVDRFLRYNFPFKDKKIVSDHISENSFCIHGDDGEKFGDWPGMYEYLYEKGTLSNTFNFFEEEGIQFITPMELIGKMPVSNINDIFIPYSSYDAMNKWSMFTEELMDIYKKNSEEFIEKHQDFFFKGNFFNFLVKYPESKSIYNKNLVYSEMFRHHEEVYEQLLRSQCCCAYWHGVFGGIYLPHLRDAINLGNVVAESYLPDGLNSIDQSIVIKNKNIACTVEKKGATISSINLFSKKINIVNAFSRKPEFTHKDITSPVYYDNTSRNSFTDHIIKGNLDADTYIRKQYGDQTEIYDCNFEFNKNGNTLETSGKAFAFINDNIVNLKFQKNFSQNGSVLKVDYSLEGIQDIDVQDNYLAVDINFHNIFGKDIHNLEGTEFELKSDMNIGIKVKVSCESRILLLPIETCSMNHQEIDNIQQSYTAVICVPLNNKEFSIELSVTDL